MNFLLQTPIPPPPDGTMPVHSCFSIAIAVAALVAFIAFALLTRNGK